MILQSLIKICVIWSIPFSMLIFTGFYSAYPIINRLINNNYFRNTLIKAK